MECSRNGGPYLGAPITGIAWLFGYVIGGPLWEPRNLAGTLKGLRRLAAVGDIYLMGPAVAVVPASN